MGRRLPLVVEGAAQAGILVMRGASEERSLIVVPAVAVIVAELRKRPAWQEREPFPVPAELYEAASAEMAAVMKKRGFPLPVSKPLKASGVENFLILGTPIISYG